MTTKLPNIIVKVILEYLLNRIIEFDYLVDFIHRFTLISKKWNEEIIRKLKVYNRLTSTQDGDYEIIGKWCQLAKRYHIDYEVALELCNNRIDYEILRDRVVTIQNAVESFTKVEYNYYKYLKEITFKIRLTEHEFPQSTEYSDTIDYNLELINISQQDTISSNILEILFNQKSFKRVQLYKMKIEGMNYHSELSLQRLILIEISVDENALCSILSRSPNLEKISLCMVDICNGEFGSILKCIADVSTQFKKLNLLFINEYKAAVAFKTIVDLLNRIQCKSVLIDFKYIVCEEIESVIENTYIEIFRFKNWEVLLKDAAKLDLLTINMLFKWKDKSHLEDVYIEAGDSLMVLESMNEMVNLKKLEIYYWGSYNSLSSNCNQLTNYLLPTKLPNLTNLKLELDKFGFTFIPDILKVHPKVTSLGVGRSGVSTKELVILLDSKQFPTLTDLSIDRVFKLNDIFEDMEAYNENAMLPIFQNNSTLRMLRIIDCEINVKNPPSFIMSVLQVNRIYSSFIVYFQPLVQYLNFYIDYNLFEQTLSNNTVIKKLLLPSTASRYGHVKYSQELINLFNKYSVNRVTYLYVQ
ncbi:hypothetical protein DLAC_04357 [Tieghemostelium lacteum]|uniref:Uncharacterized protein n=1 Tax=Tieghemostelium lacteum TaxID=361077 RepID=A0A151ZJJ8_TIELA|nr:hypothetical protein DLAC_04357 [Tieghemostelium lacteum]|eukprot:KYQ94079.1 hypothetical protein DLAC_04357 [Tieghemostelium lacteum]